MAQLCCVTGNKDTARPQALAYRSSAHYNNSSKNSSNNDSHIQS